MINKKIPLSEKDENIYLETFVPEKVGEHKRKAILIIPGGGYWDVCDKHEGEQIAFAFMAKGFNAFVLHYSVRTKAFPTQLIEASKAIKHIRDNAEAYNIDPHKVFAVGFSAGGHLTASLGTMWSKKEIYDEIDMPFGYNKPTGMMLIYPVTVYEYHNGSFHNLLVNKNPDKAKLDECSIAKNIDENSSPAYIVHSSNDEVVDVRSSLIIANAFAEKKLKFELHIYPDAPHGFALANEAVAPKGDRNNNSAISKWIDNAVYWAENICEEKN